MKTTPSERARKEIDDLAASMNGKHGAETETEKIEIPEPIIDASNLQPLTLESLGETLGLTIKKDNSNKILTFLCELSAYTEDSQFNISFNAP